MTPETHHCLIIFLTKLWVALWPIFEVCSKESGYAGGGKFLEPWWRQEAAEQQLRPMLKNSGKSKGAAETGIRQAWGGGEVGEGGSVSGSDGYRMGGGGGGFDTLVWRGGTSRWADDPVVESAKDDIRGGEKSDVRRIGWGGSNKYDT